jgi:hypothetical protein
VWLWLDKPGARVEEGMRVVEGTRVEEGATVEEGVSEARVSAGAFDAVNAAGEGDGAMRAPGFGMEWGTAGVDELACDARHCRYC